MTTFIIIPMHMVLSTVWMMNSNLERKIKTVGVQHLYNTTIMMPEIEERWHRTGMVPPALEVKIRWVKATNQDDSNKIPDQSVEEQGIRNPIPLVLLDRLKVKLSVMPVRPLMDMKEQSRREERGARQKLSAVSSTESKQSQEKGMLLNTRSQKERLNRYMKEGIMQGIGVQVAPQDLEAPTIGVTVAMVGAGMLRLPMQDISIVQFSSKKSLLPRA